MRNRFRQIGLIAAGVFIGVLISLNFSAVAQKEAVLKPRRSRAAFHGSVRTREEDYVEAPTTKAHHGSHQRDATGLDPHSAYLDREAFRELRSDAGLNWRAGDRSRDGGRLRQGGRPDRRHAASRAGVKSGDPHRQAGRHVGQGHDVERRREAHAPGGPNTQITLTIVQTSAKPLVVTLTRAVIKIQSVKSKLLEPGYAYFRVSQFQEHTGETLAKAIETLFKQNEGQMRGMVLDLRNDPGGLLNGAVAVTSAFLPAGALVVYTDGRTEDARMKLHASPENYLRGRLKDDYIKRLPRIEDGAHGGAGQRRVGLRVGDRRGRAAGSQARGGDGPAIVRQGIRRPYCRSATIRRSS
jgi:carboxyl-terminal processing protease